jgi:hypothetical protein
MSTPLEEAREAMQEAQKKLKDAKARFTAGWKRRNGEELTEQYDQEFETNALLKRFNDNLQRKEAIYLEEKKGEQQQCIGIGASGSPTSQSPEISLHERIARLDAPSTYASNFKNKVSGKEVILCHRPPGSSGLPVVALCSVFSEFQKLCTTVNVSDEDCDFVVGLCFEMSGSFSDEKARESTFHNCLRSYLGDDYPLSIPTHKCGTNTTTNDGCIQLPNLAGATGAIIELKKEVGTGGGCPFVQGACSYAKYVGFCLETNSPFATSQFPCFGIYMAGPYIGFSGFLTTDVILCDPLTNVFPLIFLGHDKFGSMLSLARVFKSFKISLANLRDWYDARTRVNFATRLFPDIDSISGVPFTYFQQPLAGKTIFVVQLQDGTNALLKITESYSEETHIFCNLQGFAPKLIGVERRHIGLVYVLMEFDPEMVIMTVFTGDRHFARNQIINRLTVLHQAGFVHGDFRLNNIMISPSNINKIWFIDFDFAGKTGVARYPPFLNRTDIQWPEGVNCMEIVRPEHDLAWIHSNGGDSNRNLLT